MQAHIRLEKARPLMVNDSSFSFDFTHKSYGTGFCLSIAVVIFVWENGSVWESMCHVMYEQLYSKILSFICETFSGYSCLTVLATRKQLFFPSSSWNGLCLVGLMPHCYFTSTTVSNTSCEFHESLFGIFNIIDLGFTSHTTVIYLSKCDLKCSLWFY